MSLLKQFVNIESMTAVLAWGVVSASSLFFMLNNAQYSGLQVAAAGICFVLFVLGFLAAITDYQYQNEWETRLTLVVIQFAAIIAATLLVPYTYVAILITIWSSQLPYLFSFRAALLTSPLWTSPIWIIYSVHWGHDFVFLSALLYWTFNLFALVMVNANIKEKKAREATLEVNRELMATQALLSEASKQAERVRIARNIHDLLGHHLTAMTINLQVASRISDGEVKEKVQQCHDLAKLLLSDVREAVSQIREKSSIELESALHALLDNVPDLEVSLEVGEQVSIDNVAQAETVIRCVQETITNTLKHSNAKRLNIKLRQAQNAIHLTMQDDGIHKNDATLKEGNGLLGMRERVNQLGGLVEVKLTAGGFVTQIQIPEAV